MLNTVRRRSQSLTRLFSLLLLAAMLYAGFVRGRAILHADACLDQGGRYDAAADVCHH